MSVSRRTATVFALLAIFAMVGIDCGGDEKPAADPLTGGPGAASPVINTANPSTAAATGTQSTEATPSVVSTETVVAAETTVAATPASEAAAPRVAAEAPAARSLGLVSRMRIPSLGVDHGMETLGVNAAGELDTPRNATGAIGWYSIPTFPAFAVPGTGGAAMFSAHINYNGADGPFVNLANIQPGAAIFVMMADGAEYTYRVFSIRGYVIDPAYATDSRPMIHMDSLVFTPGRPASEEWITLITCSCGPGRIVGQNAQGFGECLDRDVVIARRVS